MITATIEKPKSVPKAVKLTLEKPEGLTAIEPKVPIDQSARIPIDVVPAGPRPVIDSALTAVAATHTTPPYPAFARRFGHEGVVQLRMTVSAEGRVIRGDLIRSSGYAELDAAASSWVVAHWRYLPAMRGTLPVAATALAAVRFNLETAR